MQYRSHFSQWSGASVPLSISWINSTPVISQPLPKMGLLFSCLKSLLCKGGDDELEPHTPPPSASTRTKSSPALFTQPMGQQGKGGRRARNSLDRSVARGSGRFFNLNIYWQNWQLCQFSSVMRFIDNESSSTINDTINTLEQVGDADLSQWSWWTPLVRNGRFVFDFDPDAPPFPVQQAIHWGRGR